MLRTIMIFPDFENIEKIKEIREKYDPSATLVEPHITIVFPFESELKNTDIEKILNARLNDIAAFNIKLCGVSKQVDKFGNYLFLNVIEGQKEILKINKQLYNNEFKKFDLGLTIYHT